MSCLPSMSPPTARRFGRVATLVGLAAWAGWLVWRMSSLVEAATAVDAPRPLDVVSNAMVLAYELVAIACAALVARGFWRPGSDGTVAWRVIGDDGIRRAVAVAGLLAVLLLGAAPVELPPRTVAALLIVGLIFVSIGTWALSAGQVRPLDRTVRSVGAIGVAAGQGESRGALGGPWFATMATIVALNVAVALRGMSDRWTHGLPPMTDGSRFMAIAFAAVIVGAGLAALRRLHPPDLQFFGPTRRLEELSARRLALGATLSLAVVGTVASGMPTGW